MADRVAGHVFVGVGSDQRCSLPDCPRWWTEIMDCNEDDLDKPHLAHSGNLNLTELGEIRIKRKQEMRFWDAVEAAAG